MPSGRSFAPRSMMLKKVENNVGASLLDAVGGGEAARQRPIVLHLTLMTFMELEEDGEKFAGDSQGEPGFSTAHHG